MSKRWLATVSGPLAEYAPGFAEELIDPRLLEVGGEEADAFARPSGPVARNGGSWSSGPHGGIGSSHYSPPDASEGRSNLLTTKSLKPFLGFLRRAGMPEPPTAAPTDPLDLMVDRFRRHLVHERGLVEGTVRFYVHVAGLFLSGTFGDRGSWPCGPRSSRCHRVHRAGVRGTGAVFGSSGGFGTALAASLAPNGGFDPAGT